MEAVIEQLSAYEIEPQRRTGGKPMPTRNHSVIQGNQLVELKPRYRQQYTFLPEINLSMPERPDTVPDIAIYPKLEIDFLHDEIAMTQMPLTVIEISSPPQPLSEIIAKFERYFNAGVKSCWLVIPNMQAVAVYSEIGKYQFFTKESILTDPATGIGLALAEVFA